MKTLFLAILLAAHAAAVDVRTLISATALTVNNSTATTIRAGLQNTTTIQMYVKGSGTAQIYTLTLPDSTTIEVPSSGILTLRFATPLANGDIVGTILTATGSTAFQVISMREYK